MFGYSWLIILGYVYCQTAIFEWDCSRGENGLDFENHNISDLEIDDSDNVYDLDSYTEPSHLYRLRIKIQLRSVKVHIEGKGRNFM